MGDLLQKIWCSTPGFFAICAGGGFLSAYVIVSAVNLVAPYDDSDPPGGRSNLMIYTDHLTGCQYLSAGLHNALFPRLDTNGKQICNKDGKNG